MKNSLIFKNAILGGLCALSGNLLIFYFFRVVLGVEFLLPAHDGSGLVALPAWDIPVSSFVPAVAGGLIFMLLKKTTAKPEIIFIIISITVLMLSFLPLLIDVSLAVKAGFFIMHVYAAAIITWFILKSRISLTTSI
ncbi:MAG: DUF6069 family protein [Cytophagaceae bacterium]